MGLRKLILKHGLGSVGSTAKAMAVTFNKIQRMYPELEYPEVLYHTLEARYSSNELERNRIVDILEEAEYSLYKLIIIVLFNEYSQLSTAPREIMADIAEIIIEQQEKYAPYSEVMREEYFSKRN